MSTSSLVGLNVFSYGSELQNGNRFVYCVRNCKFRWDPAVFRQQQEENNIAQHLQGSAKDIIIASQSIYKATILDIFKIANNNVKMYQNYSS